jgi:hypothetical protein
MRARQRRGRVWGEHNLITTYGVEALRRRPPNQQEDYEDVDPQPQVMIPVIDESDPHANQRDSSSVTYGVLYCLREDDVRDKDQFWYRPHMLINGVWQPTGQRFLWGVIGPGRWNQNHALTGVNFGVKQFRIRKGG